MVAVPKGTQAVYERSHDELPGRNSMNAQGEVAAVNTGEEAKRLSPQWLSRSVIRVLFLNKDQRKGANASHCTYSKVWLFLDSGWVRTNS